MYVASDLYYYKLIFANVMQWRDRMEGKHDKVNV